MRMNLMSDVEYRSMKVCKTLKFHEFQFKNNLYVIFKNFDTKKVSNLVQNMLFKAHPKLEYKSNSTEFKRLKILIKTHLINA